MKRDLDLIREMMQQLEENPELNGRDIISTSASELFTIEGKSDDELAYHLLLILDEGWLEGRYFDINGSFDVVRLTAEGHDFIDATRNPDIWKRARSAMETGGTATLRFAWDLAKSIAKKEIEKRLPID